MHLNLYIRIYMLEMTETSNNSIICNICLYMQRDIDTCMVLST